MRVGQLTECERELIHRLALITGYSDIIVRDVIKAQTEFVIDEIKNGTPVRLGGLGEIRLGTKRARAGYNFATKEVYRGMKDVPIVVYKPSAGMKRAVKIANGELAEEP